MSKNDHCNLTKTNAMRLLESAGIAFVPYVYDVADGAIDARAIARKLALPVEQVFKTLVTATPDRHDYFVFVVPAVAELNLKHAAKAAQVKAVEMIKQKELLPLTGYVHGGCSPIGMKKAFPTFIEESAILYDKIWVSGGQVGLNLSIAPEALAGLVDANFADIADYELN